MTAPIVDVRDVHKRFGGVHALRGVDLRVAPGTVHALLGPNGAGKTTLVNVLSTLTTPDAGTARVAGHDVSTDPAAVRRAIGLAGQFAAVDDYLTGRETVEMVGRLYGWSAREARRRAADVLERFQLADAADRPAKGYSGGMRRRLDLAASLVGEPDLIFLDEPTTGIDPGSRLDIWDLVEDLIGGGTTVLLTTQYLEEADALADRIGVIDHGRLVREGTADELKRSLGGNVIRVRVGHGDVDRARAALDGLDALDEPARGVFTTAAPDGKRTLRDVLTRLDAGGVEPVTLAWEQPSLDEVFLSLTGQRPPTDAAHREVVEP